MLCMNKYNFLFWHVFSPLCLRPLFPDSRMCSFPTEKYSHMINSLWKTHSWLKTCIFSSISHAFNSTLMYKNGMTFRFYIIFIFFVMCITPAAQYRDQNWTCCGWSAVPCCACVSLSRFSEDREEKDMFNIQRELHHSFISINMLKLKLEL